MIELAYLINPVIAGVYISLTLALPKLVGEGKQVFEIEKFIQPLVAGIICGIAAAYLGVPVTSEFVVTKSLEFTPWILFILGIGKVLYRYYQDWDKKQGTNVTSTGY